MTDYISIRNNTTLREITGFDSLISLRTLDIRTNLGLETISGFRALERVNYEITIIDNANLITLTDGFGDLSYTENFYVRDNEALCYGEVQQTIVQFDQAIRRVNLDRNRGSYDACGTCGGQVDRVDRCVDVVRDNPWQYRCVDVSAYLADCNPDGDFFNAKPRQLR